MSRGNTFKKVKPELSWVFYFRSSIERLNSVLGKKELNGITVAIIQWSGGLYAGVSCCSKRDIWDKERGKEIAYQRAKLAVSNDVTTIAKLYSNKRTLNAYEIYTAPDTVEYSTKDIKDIRKRMLNLAREVVAAIKLDPGVGLKPKTKAQVIHRTRVEHLMLSEKHQIATALSI